MSWKWGIRMGELGSATVQVWARKKEYEAFVRRLQSRQTHTTRKEPGKLVEAMQRLWEQMGGRVRKWGRIG